MCAVFAWVSDPNNLTAVSTAVIAVFTVVLAFVSIRQIRQTQESIGLARDEFRASHRPQIIVHSVEFLRIGGEEEDRIGASILCFNIGRAAAQNIDVRGDILVTHDLGIDIQRPLIKTFAEIPSGLKLRFEVRSDRPVRELGHLLKQATPYCIGSITYLDQNQTRRETGFCFVIKEIGSHGARWVSAESPEHEYAF